MEPTPYSAARAQAALLLLLLGLLTGTMLLGSSVYQRVVDVPNWIASLPDTANDFRAALRYSTPTSFYVPLNVATALALIGSTIVAGWRHPRTRNWWALGGVAAVVANVVVTVMFVLPRNQILFFDPIGANSTDAIIAAASEWQVFHYLRIALYAACVVAAVRALLLATTRGTETHSA